MRGFGLRVGVTGCAVVLVAFAAPGSALADKPDKAEKPKPGKATPVHEAVEHAKGPKPKKEHEHGKEAAPAMPTPRVEPAESPPPRAHPAKGPKSHGSAAPHEKVTLCHATGSRKNPYVVITVSVNATTGNGHGRHEDDIIPAPAGGCPRGEAEEPGGDDPAEGGGAPPPESKDPPSGPPSDMPHDVSPLPAAYVGGASPAAEGSLPFTGMSLAQLVLLGLGCLVGGLVLRGGVGRRSRRVPAARK